MGATSTWPQSFRTALGLCLVSPQPSAVFWGQQQLQFANEAYRQWAGQHWSDGRLGYPLQMPDTTGWQALLTDLKTALQTGQTVCLSQSGAERADVPAGQWMCAPILDETLAIGGVLLTIQPSLVESDPADQRQASLQSDVRLQPEDLRLMTELLPQQIWIAQPDGRVDYVNRRWSEMLGVEPSEILELGWANQLHPDDLPQVMARWQHSLKTGEDYSVEARLLTATGEYRWILGKAIALKNEQGEVLRWYGSNTDIHNLKQIESALRESEAIAQARAHELSTFMETVPTAVWVAHDPQCHHVTANRAAYELLRMPPGGEMTATPANHEYPFPFKIQRQGQELPLDQLPMQLAASTGQAVEANFELVFGEQDMRFIYGKSVPLFDDAHRVRGVVGAFLDLTEHNQTVAALRRSEEQLRAANERFLLAARAVNALIYDWDLTQDRVERTEGITRILGYALNETEETNAWWHQIVHPDDLPQLRAAEQAVREGQDHFSIEYRVLNRQKTYVDVQDQGIVVARDATGKPLRIVGSTVDIHDRKQADREQQTIEVALRTSEVRYRSIVEDAPDAILIFDTEGNLVTVNNNACQLLGYRRETLISRSILELLVPEDLPRLKSLPDRLGDGSTATEEWTLINSHGQTVSVEASIKMLPDHRWQAFVRDIRDRKVAEAKLKSFADSNIIGLLFGDIHGNVFDANDELLRIVGYTRDDLNSERLNWTAITPPEYLSLDIDRIAEARSYGACSPYEKEYIRKDGSRVPVLMGYSLIAPDYEETVAFCVDLTQQKQAEAERDRLLKREQAARAEAERANRIKDEFLAVLSHELRSPLNPILGWASLLQQRQVDPKTQRRALETIARNIKLQLQLIDDLLDVSRILRGKLPLEHHPVRLEKVVNAAVETIQLAAEAKSIQIQVKVNSAVSPVLGDEGRLQQVVWNLLSNAVKFTPNGGQVNITLSANDTEAHIQVQDNGIGISSNFLPHVFEYFRQADGSTTRRFGGLGLGLAIVRYLTEMHGGTVVVDSRGEGQGATFTICLPTLPRAIQADPAAPPTGTTPPQEAALKAIQILLVEDDDDSRDFLRFLLDEAGATVTAIPSAKSALTALQAQLPDIVISDIGMPEMDGYALIQQIRRLPPDQGGQLPAIALTAYAADSDIEKTLAAGFQRHVSKPVEPSRLVQVVLDLLKGK